MKKIALVTGGNRGIGFEVCKQLAQNNLKVILGSRDPHSGSDAAKKLTDLGLDVTELPLDVSDRESILEAFRYVENSVGRLDVLVNNAGILIDDEEEGVEAIRKTLETNVYGPYQLCEVFVPLMKKNNYGRIVNVSSGMGQLTEMDGGYPAYRISKTALNAVTRIFAADVREKNILINSVCPGWVKTDMGGSQAERPVEKGAETILWLATLPDRGPSGGFFRDKKPIPW